MKKLLESSDHFELRDVLFILAVILIILQANQSYHVYKDPCNYCVINTGYEKITCKEYFNNTVPTQLNFIINYTNESFNNTVPTQLNFTINYTNERR